MTAFFDFTFDPGKFAAAIPTLMSVVGSVNVARLVKKAPSFRGSAKRILFGMSLCEVVSSIAFSLQSLFIPRQTSHFLWAIGSGSPLGLIMQFSILSYVYSCLMSFIYLSRVHLNTTNRDFVAKRIEPWIGTLGFGYPVVTALIGAGMILYSEMEIPRDDEATRALSDKIGQIPGSPLTFMFAAIVVNTLVMFSVAGRKGFRTNGVATAAVLLTYVWTAVLRVFESNDIRRSNNEAGLYPLLMLQAFLLPVLGLFNLGTWLQPRVHRVRDLYPYESMTWCVGRVLIGERLITPSKGPETRRRTEGFNYESRLRCRF